MEVIIRNTYAGGVDDCEPYVRCGRAGYVDKEHRWPIGDPSHSAHEMVVEWIYRGVAYSFIIPHPLP